MPLVKNTLTGNNYLVKINTDGDSCSRTAIRSYNKQLGSQGSGSRTIFTLPFNYSPSSHTLWVFVNGEKAVVEQTAANNRQYEEISDRAVEFGASLNSTDVLEFIVAGSYLNDTEVGGGSGGGLAWILTGDTNLSVTNDMGYMIDTTSNPITFNLPAAPAEGDTFAVADAFGNFGTNNAILHPLNPSHRIQFGNVGDNFIFDKDGMAAQFVFDGVDNWLIVNDSGFVTDTEWQIVSSNTSVVNGGKYFVDTLTGTSSLTITPPASPEIDDEFVISDYAGSWGIYNVIVAQNGQRIMGINDNLTMNVSNVTARFVFTGATQGWRIVDISS